MRGDTLCPEVAKETLALLFIQAIDIVGGQTQILPQRLLVVDEISRVY